MEGRAPPLGTLDVREGEADLRALLCPWRNAEHHQGDGRTLASKRVEKELAVELKAKGQHTDSLPGNKCCLHRWNQMHHHR